MNPAIVCPMVGANYRGVNMAVSIGEDTGIRDEAEGSLVVLSANKEARFYPGSGPRRVKPYFLLV